MKMDSMQKVDTYVNFWKEVRAMSGQSHTIVDMAEIWDELTPRQQMLMIQRARGLAGYNKMQAKGITFEDLKSAVSEASAPSGTTNKEE